MIRFFKRLFCFHTFHDFMGDTLENTAYTNYICCKCGKIKSIDSRDVVFLCIARGNSLHESKTIAKYLKNN